VSEQSVLNPEDAGWDLPRPFILPVTVRAEDIDDFDHANNSVYLRWADQNAWAHWAADGFQPEDCRAEDRGMAIMRTEADYLGHCRLGDEIACAVWIARSDGKLRAERWYQYRRVSDGETVFRAVTRLVCFQLSTGRPARMSPSFARHYAKPAADLSAAADALDARLKRS
jgi:acyl-CoA thioester hydrolase